MTHIAILYTVAGGGHVSLACSAQDALNTHAPQIHTSRFDPFPEPFSSTHKTLIHHFLDVYRVGYKVTENPQVEPTIRRLTDLAITPQLVKFCKKYHPDILIANHPLIATILPNVIDKLNYTPKTIVHFADPFTTHQSWFFNKQADLYLSPTKEMSLLAQSAGISKSQIKTIGWLLRKPFYTQNHNPSQIKSILGIDPKKFTVFIGGTGQGSADTLKLCQYIFSSMHHTKLQLIVNPGLDTNTVTGLLELVRKYPDTLTLIPYANNIPQLLAASDLVVGKAGPNFMFETLYLKKPLMITSYLPGQENGNVEFIQKNHLGFVYLNPKSAAQKILHLAQNPSEQKVSFSTNQYIASPKKFVAHITQLI